MDGFADAELSLNQAVFKSESDTNQHNRAIAYLLQSAGFMYSDPMEACDVYTRECSVGITPKNLAIMAGTLANGGVNPLSKKRLLDEAYVPKILAEMAVEGLYRHERHLAVAYRRRAGWEAASWRSLPGTGRSQRFLRRWMVPATACDRSSRSPGSLRRSLTTCPRARPAVDDDGGMAGAWMTRSGQPVAIERYGAMVCVAANAATKIGPRSGSTMFAIA